MKRACAISTVAAAISTSVAIISTVLVVGLLLFVVPALARPVNPADRLPQTIEDTAPAEAARAPLPRGLAATPGVHDTVLYGGTYWAADSMRWEAIRGGTWTFDTGVGSAFGATGPNKPAGYHTLMEGWYGIDQSLNPLPYFRRSTTCAIHGSWSLWAGVDATEAAALCYSSGQGYGNNWNMEVRKSFAYGGAGNVNLSYLYRNESEEYWDYSFVLVDTSGTGAAPDIELARYTGIPSGTANLTLTPGATLPVTAHNIILKLVFYSDDSYSDQDGLNPTTCGGVAFDDISLSGAITDFTDFEGGMNGWAETALVTGHGDFSNIVDRNTALPAPLTFCACGIRDSVLVFYDESSGHPLNQDNVAASPWIDLKRGGDAGRPMKLLTYSVYAEMPLANYVFTQARARWYPSVCSANGNIYVTPWHDANIVYYYGEPPFCTAAGVKRIIDYSGVIEQTAEQVQICFGAVNLCEGNPFGQICTGVTNTTPWFDNIALGVSGSASAPNITMTTFDMLQDNFAADGQLNLASPGRIDTGSLKNLTTPAPYATFRDTLCARGDGGNTEVRLVFHVRPGPFTNGAALATRAALWTAEPSLGSGWYSARMDTAEQGGVKSTSGVWMSCFHEADPAFAMIGGDDRTIDPNDYPRRGRASNKDILPDNLFTPGSRIDYFVAARYLPGDPRNPGDAWYVLPDTTGRHFYEVEILPSSAAADSTWNCTLYVDHHADRDVLDRQVEEAGLTAALGIGGNNAEGTRYDRYDVQTPSSGQLSFGRSLGSTCGASNTQAYAYNNIVWHSGTIASTNLSAEDANVVQNLLAGSVYLGWGNYIMPGYRRFWGSGDGLVKSMSTSGNVTIIGFMRNTLGVNLTCNTVRDAACPAGTTLDSTFCLPLHAAAGGEFPPTAAASVRGNGCPDLRSLDVLSAWTSAAGAKGQLAYAKNGADVTFASVTHRFMRIEFGDTTDTRTVVDGFAIGAVRATPIDPHTPALCSDVSGAYARTQEVLGWFGSAPVCGPPPIVDVPDDGTSRPPQFRTSLGNAYPNPAAGRAATRIQFTNGVEGGRVTLKVFDVTGRLVRTLLADQKTTAGPHEVTWDGRTDDGFRVSGGMYFYKLSAPGYEAAKKLVILN